MGRKAFSPGRPSSSRQVQKLEVAADRRRNAHPTDGGTSGRQCAMRCLTSAKFRSLQLGGSPHVRTSESAATGACCSHACRAQSPRPGAGPLHLARGTLLSLRSSLACTRGLRMGRGEESFDITVCSPEWLAAACSQVGLYDARHHLVINVERGSTQPRLTQLASAARWKRFGPEPGMRLARSWRDSALRKLSYRESSRDRVNWRRSLAAGESGLAV